MLVPLEICRVGFRIITGLKRNQELTDQFWRNIEAMIYNIQNAANEIMIDQILLRDNV